MSDKQNIQHVITGGIGAGRTVHGLRARKIASVDPMGEHVLEEAVDGARVMRLHRDGEPRGVSDPRRAAGRRPVFWDPQSGTSA